LTVSVHEIRDRAERFRRALIEERLEVRAGRKAWPEFASLYESQAALQHTETMPAIERELASATGEDERRVRRLLSWAAQHHVQRQTAPLDDEYAFWAATAATGTRTSDLSLGAITRAVANTSNRGNRAALDGARTRLLEEAIPLQLDRVTRWRTATEELGYGDVLQATERLGGVNLDGLLIESRRLVEETRDAYGARLAEELHTRVGVEPRAAASHDLAWLRRMSWLDEDLENTSVLDTVRDDLEQLGLPLKAGGRVELRGGSFAEAGASPLCAPLDVPGSVVFLVTGVATMPGWQTLLKEVGKTLHYAYTDPGLPFEYRMIGDTAVIRAHGDLFEDLTRSATWLERMWKSDEASLQKQLRLAALVDLYRVRRLTAALEFQMEMSEAGRPEEMGERWADLVESATGFRFSRRLFLERLGHSFAMARALRGRMLAAQLQRELNERFGDDWFRNSRSGPFLRAWFAYGLRQDSSQRAAQLGRDRLNADALIAASLERLGGC
jgi:hypothetical protein